MIGPWKLLLYVNPGPMVLETQILIQMDAIKEPQSLKSTAESPLSTWETKIQTEALVIISTLGIVACNLGERAPTVHLWGMTDIKATLSPPETEHKREPER